MKKMSILELESLYLTVKAAVNKLMEARKAFVLKTSAEPPGCGDVVAQFDTMSKQYESYRDDIVDTQDLKALIAIMGLVPEFIAVRADAKIYINIMSESSALH